VIAGGEIRNQRPAIEVYREIEIAFAARRNAADFLHGRHAQLNGLPV